jgi:lipopolysaccharide exporter
MKIEMAKNPTKIKAARNDPGKGNNGFADNVLTLTGGAAVAMAVSIIASPITSRLFDPEAFGLAALFMSGVTIIGLIACLRYEMTIVLPKSDEDAASIFSLCLIALAIITTVTSVFTLMFGGRVLVLLNANKLKPILWLFPLYVFLEGSRLLINYWHMRQRRFNIPSIGRVYLNIPTSISEIIGGWAGLRTGGNLVVLRIFGLIISPLFLFLRVSKADVHMFLQNARPKKMYNMAKKYMKFPLVDSWAILIIQLSWYAPIILIPAFFGPVIGGLYTKAISLLFLPTIVIGESVDQVFLQKSAALKAEGGNLTGLVEAVFNRMITIAILPFSILMIIGPELFGFFLGASWFESGVYSQIMCPYFFVSFLLLSIRNLFGTLEKQELNLISIALLTVTSVVIIILGGIFLKDARMTLLIMTVFCVGITIWRILMLMHTTSLSGLRQLHHFMRCFVYAVPTLVLISAMKWWFCLEAVYLIASGIIFSSPYFVFVLRHDLELRNFVTRTMFRLYSSLLSPLKLIKKI